MNPHIRMAKICAKTAPSGANQALVAAAASLRATDDCDNHQLYHLLAVATHR